MSAIDDNDDDDIVPSRIDWKLWRRIAAHVAAYRRSLVGIIAFGIVLAIADVALALITGTLVDRATTGAAMAGLWVTYASTIAVFGLSIWTLIALAGRLASGVGHDLRREGFRRLQQLSFSYFDRRPVGWLVSRLTSDCDKVSGLMPWFALDLVWGPTLATGVVVAMFVVDPTLALWVVMITPPIAATSVYFQRRLLGTARLVRRTNSRITAAFSEAVMGVRTTKTLVREAAASAEFGELARLSRTYSIRESVQAAVYLPIVMSLGAIGVGMALWQGGLLLGTDLSPGTLVAFMQLAALFHTPIEDIARRLAELQGAQAAAERIQTLLDTTPEIRDAPEVTEAIARHAQRGDADPALACDGLPARIREIELRGVTFGYDPERPVLHDIDLRVHAGQTIALVGETGGGKTSLVSLIARFYDLQRGQILLDGFDHRTRSLAWLQSTFGVVLQTPHLLRGSIAENIRYGRLAATRDEVIAAARLAHADRFIERLPDGYDTQVGEAGARLSTGQRQLVALARAILADPQILVLDEATSSVDTETEAAIQRGIEEVLQGRIAFVIAHRLSTIRRADLICVIEDGRIVERGSHRELLARHGRYWKLVSRGGPTAAWVEG
jgi:ATP-binding cassette subfamily B protein